MAETPAQLRNGQAPWALPTPTPSEIEARGDVAAAVGDIMEDDGEGSRQSSAPVANLGADFAGLAVSPEDRMEQDLCLACVDICFS